jgi:hypothetical protein
MQRLSMSILTAIAVLALSGADFTKPAPPSTSSTKKTFDQPYYWYSALDGSYNDYEGTSYEIWEMEIYYDCYVSTSPVGNTLLIEKGFTSTNPNLPAMVFLYAHL